jgi:3-phosphoshikimate 1-carboxyvinyltransferase
MLLAMGCSLEPPGCELQPRPSLTLVPGNRLQAIDVTVPGDFSSAAFLIVAATLLPGSEIVIEGVGVNPTRTGLLDVLRAMGAHVRLQNEQRVGGEPVADLDIHAAGLHGAQIGGDLVVRMIDEFPILAVAATQAQGKTTVRDAAELRVKESDRIAATIRELGRLGAEIEPRPDGFTVHGPTPLTTPAPRPGQDTGAVHSHGDHRLAMSLIVAGLISTEGACVQDVGCIADSFPGFQDALTSLGVQLS